MADKVMVMDKGKVLAYDEPRRIGRMLAGSGEDDRHPMFYGLPAMMKIYQSAENGDDSPLTIREGRLWIDSKIGDAYREGVPGAKAGDADQENESAETSGVQSGQKDPAITVKDLWFRYDRKSQDVLRDLNFTIDKGQLFCVLGGNGVGKSTTLKVVSKILKQQRGKVTVNGTLAMLPQNPQALFTEISVEDEMMEALHDSGDTDEVKVQKVLDMLDTMEIKHLRKSHPYDLSGGEQQRLALGKVLLLDPEIILLDEATKGLDPFFKISLARVLKKLTDAGKTLFMVSHDIEFCAEYADTCAMFFDGQIVSVGKPHEFFPGNNFYTTSANKMARDHFPDAITWEEVAACVRETI